MEGSITLSLIQQTLTDFRKTPYLLRTKNSAPSPWTARGGHHAPRRMSANHGQRTPPPNSLTFVVASTSPERSLPKFARKPQTARTAQKHVGGGNTRKIKVGLPPQRGAISDNVAYFSGKECGERHDTHGFMARHHHHRGKKITPGDTARGNLSSANIRFKLMSSTLPGDEISVPVAGNGPPQNDAEEL